MQINVSFGVYRQTFYYEKTVPLTPATVWEGLSDKWLVPPNYTYEIWNNDWTPAHRDYLADGDFLRFHRLKEDKVPYLEDELNSHIAKMQKLNEQIENLQKKLPKAPKGLVSVEYDDQVTTTTVESDSYDILYDIYNRVRKDIQLPDDNYQVKVEIDCITDDYYPKDGNTGKFGAGEVHQKIYPGYNYKIKFRPVGVRRGMLIINPKYAKLPRYEATAKAYDSNPEEYQTGTTAAAAAGIISSLVILGSIGMAIFLASFWLVLTLVAGVVAAVTIPPALYRANFAKNVDEIMVRTPEKKMLADTFSELHGLTEVYHQNLSAVPQGLKAEVSIDEGMLRQRQWEVAKHIHTLDTFYSMGRDKRGNNGDLLNDTYTQIRGEVETLGNAVQNLIDIGIVSATEDIKLDYVDPTVGEILQATTLHRLQGYRELMPSKDSTQLQAAEKLLSEHPKSDQALAAAGELPVEVHKINEPVGLKPKQTAIRAREQTKKL